MQTRIGQNEELIAILVQGQEKLSTRTNRVEDMMGKFVDTQGMIIKLLDRMDQKLDNLANPGKNGHS
jgi:hypothetical protein